MRNFYGSQSQFGCMTCTINTRQDDLIYNPTIHREKNISELHALTISAEPVLKRKIWNLRRPTAPERAILDSCHDQCIYPVIFPYDFWLQKQHE